VEVVLADAESAAQLLGSTTPLPGLTITDDLDAALNALEVELLRRSRLLANQDIADVAAYAAFDPAEPLPTVVLVADGRHQPLPPRLHAVLVAGRRFGIIAVLLGTNPVGPTITADAAGTITSIQPDGTLAELVGARLYTLSLEETVQLLRVIAAASGAEPPTAEPPPPPPAAAAPEPTAQPAPTSPPATDATTSRPVEVQMLGPLQIHLDGRQLSKGLRSKAIELLAYLLVHPAGVTRDAAIEALWPELDPDRGVAWFKAVLGNLRRTLNPSGRNDASPIPRVVDRYQANPELVGCDLWRFQHALSAAAAEADPAAKTAALQGALAVYQGDLVDGADYDWALTEREDLRRQAITAASRLADLHQQAGDHQSALDVLERAVRWDLYNEQLYQRIMRIHALQGRMEEIRRTYRRLELRMADLDDDPSEPTR
jgi:DNA-binding SARP family transcriptional activator